MFPTDLMMSQIIRQILFFFAACVFAQTGLAVTDDEAYEAAILAGVHRGESLWLTSGGSKFFSLYTEETLGSPQGGIILIHDAGGHPNWAGVIGPLRRRLPDFGWSTLSIQLPEIPSSLDSEKVKSLRQETDARIGAAIQEFSKRNIRNIALIGHGMGARLSAGYLAKGQSSGVSGFVGISLETTPGRTPDLIELLKALEGINLPVLDLFGSHDNLGVLQTAKRRVLAARRGANLASAQQNQKSFRFSSVAESSLTRSRGPIAYRQIKIDGADHFFTGLEEPLIKRVRGWLKRHTAGVKVKLKQ